MRIAGTMLDITAARQAEEDARVAQQRMTHVSRLATMGEMAAGIAHELNQPLAAITNYASAATRLVAAGTEPEDVKMALEQIAGRRCAPARSSGACAAWCRTARPAANRSRSTTW